MAVPAGVLELAKLDGYDGNDVQSAITFTEEDDVTGTLEFDRCRIEPADSRGFDECADTVRVIFTRNNHVGAAVTDPGDTLAWRYNVEIDS